jgi:cell division initiation protein
MDVTPETILDVQFREKLRGYHPDDVDEFLKRVARTVEALEGRVREANQQALAAEQRAAQAAGVEESLQRTLVLAQRTADLAIQEGREEAAAIVAEARAEREAIVAEAEELRARLAAEAEADVRAELVRLHELRDVLQADVAALERYIDDERERVRDVLSEQIRLLDAGLPRQHPAPAVREVELPEPLGAPDPSAHDDEAGGAAGAPVGVEPATTEDAGAQPGPEAELAEDDHDEFIAELRRAITDEEPLGPSDHPLPQPHDEQFDILGGAGEEGGGFASRLRRRR